MPTPSPDEKDATIALLLERLADVSAECEALAALRSEAEGFDPAYAVQSVALALLSLEASAEGP